MKRPSSGVVVRSWVFIEIGVKLILNASMVSSMLSNFIFEIPFVTVLVDSWPMDSSVKDSDIFWLE